MDIKQFSLKLYCVKCTDENYQQHKTEDIAILIKLTGWSQNDAAKIVGVKHDTKRGSSTIRKWKSDKSKKEHRETPYSA